MSQGRVQRRFVTARLQALSDQGHEPTTEEFATAVSLEHLPVADMVAARVQAEAAQADNVGENADEEEVDPDTGLDPPEDASRSRSKDL